MATVPMAILTIGSVLAGIVLLMTGHALLVLWGCAVFGGGTLLAPLLERLIVRIDDVAVRRRTAVGRAAVQPVALLSGALPVAIILGWEVACFQLFQSAASGAPALPLWMWSYGVATGPWTVFALRVSRFRRTLCSIRAYAGHLAYWLLSALVLLVGVPLGAAAATMILPAILPLVVGTLLAVADRDALRNVRV